MYHVAEFEGISLSRRRGDDQPAGRRLVLEPVADSWEWLDGIGGKLDSDFAEAVKEKPAPQERPEIEKLFR
ncbi:MAG TPA: hypothetical protein VHY79_14705 [Rhizomicrobium sp.]|jgi:virulence-associated protein VagC|nr:hypothetical protein [Rhizomicrobium sp.]